MSTNFVVYIPWILFVLTSRKKTPPVVDRESFLFNRSYEQGFGVSAGAGAMNFILDKKKPYDSIAGGWYKCDKEQSILFSADSIKNAIALVLWL